MNHLVCFAEAYARCLTIEWEKRVELIFTFLPQKTFGVLGTITSSEMRTDKRNHSVRKGTAMLLILLLATVQSALAQEPEWDWDEVAKHSGLSFLTVADDRKMGVQVHTDMGRTMFVRAEIPISPVQAEALLWDTETTILGKMEKETVSPDDFKRLVDIILPEGVDVDHLSRKMPCAVLRRDSDQSMRLFVLDLETDKTSPRLYYLFRALLPDE